MTVTTTTTPPAPAPTPAAAAAKVRSGVNVRNILDTLKDIQDACTQAKEDIMKGKSYHADEVQPIKALSKLMTELNGYDTTLTGKARPVEVNPTEPVK